MSDNEAEGTDAPEEVEAAEAATPQPATEHGVLITEAVGHTVFHPTAEQYLALVKSLRDENFQELFVDLTAVDYLIHPGRTGLPEGVEPKRFELVFHTRSLSMGTRCRVKLQLDDGEEVATITQLYPGAETPEREVYDMFGITFTDHPDMSRILMPEEWVGHPLRKDYDVGRIPVQFKGAPSAR